MVCKALVIGINYMYSGVQLNGCIQDAKNIGVWLELHCGFPKQNIHILTDDHPLNSPLRPNKANILKAIGWLLDNCDQDDFCFISFSGHGSCVYDYAEHHLDTRTNLIYVLKRTIIEIFDHEIRQKLVTCPAKIVCLLDCCQSGSMFNLKYRVNSEFKIHSNIEESTGNILVISSCGDDEFAEDTPEGGFLTINFLRLLMQRPNMSLLELSTELHRLSEGRPMKPVIHCGKLTNLSSPVMNCDQIPAIQYRYSVPHLMFL